MSNSSARRAAPTPPPPVHSAKDTERENARTLSGLRRLGGLWLWLAMGAPLLGGILLVAQAWTLAAIVGEVIQQGADINALTPAIALVLILLLARAALAAIGDRAGTAASEAIKSSVRQILFAQLLARSPRAARQPPSGAASSAIIDQVEALDGFFARYMPAMVQAGFLPLAFGAFILPLDWL
ncbi:MAG TPA: ABC transporter transmembrane domain-containing protein, partial [Devosia sp.]|nr:ABC transporter transmembrane domain-containing protein [Devosia sp.]